MLLLSYVVTIRCHSYYIPLLRFPPLPPQPPYPLPCPPPHSLPLLLSSCHHRCSCVTEVGWRVAAAPVAALAEDAVEADLPSIDLADRVALVVLLSFLINDDIVIFIISLDYLERARALPLETTQGR